MKERLPARTLPTEKMEVTGDVEQSSPDTRHAFEPPLLLWTEPFQPVAYGMACGKNPGGGGQCNNKPSFS